jgi:uncharacterized protein
LDAKRIDWKGPLILDEIPYWISETPELESILQNWVDHEAKSAGLVVAMAGSSQRMMQGLVLDANAPLYGRAAQILKLSPIPPKYLKQALGLTSPLDIVEHYATWGGIPRYWELASHEKGSLVDRIDRLVLDPLGPLHLEADRLLLEENASTHELRPVLDAIGFGAHRVSEMAGRMGRPATSLSRPLARLAEMDLIRREVPFGESEKKSKRSYYVFNDPFFRLWFRVIAPHRGILASCTPTLRKMILGKYWNNLSAMAWKTLCRDCLAQLPKIRRRKSFGPLLPPARWWRGNAPQWDVVTTSMTGETAIVGECKWSRTPFSHRALTRLVEDMINRRPPQISRQFEQASLQRILLVPEIEEKFTHPHVIVVTAKEIIKALE